MEALINQLKSEVIAQLNLENLSPDDIKPEAPLFGEGLGLDSIDALELVVLLEKKYGLRIDDPDEGRKVFYSIKTIADYIKKNKKG